MKHTVLSSLIFMLYSTLGLGQIQDELNHIYYNNEQIDELFQSPFQTLDYVAESGQKKSKKEYRKFVFKYNFGIERLLRSGSILFNNSISSYLNEKLDVLRNSFESDETFKIYLTRKSTFNAFTNDFGKIFVNVGSLSSLDYEEEIYALIAHEMAHVILKHSHEFDEYQKKLDEDNWKNFENSELLDFHSFSKHQEFEADSLGFEILKTAGINLAAASNIFRSLKFMADPCIQGSFESKIFVAEKKWHDSFISETMENVILDSSIMSKHWNDSSSTHPNIDSRYERIQSLFGIDTNKLLLNNTDQFEKMKRLSQKILIQSYREDGDYIRGLDLVLKLRESHPNDNYLIENQARYLCYLVQDKNRRLVRSQVFNYPGENYSDNDFAKFKIFLLQLSPVELNCLALDIVSELETQNETVDLDRFQSVLFQELYDFHSILFFSQDKMLRLKSNVFQERAYMLNGQSLEIDLRISNDPFVKHILKEGSTIFDYNSADSTIWIVDKFLSSYKMQEKDFFSIRDLKEKTRKRDQGLTISRYGISLINEKGRFKNVDLAFEGKLSKDWKNKSVLGQSICLQIGIDNSGKFNFEAENSLKMEDLVSKVILKSGNFRMNYGIVQQEGINMRELNNHYVLSNWISENLELHDKSLSIFDSELNEFMNRNNLEHIAFNLNIQYGKSKKKPEYFLTYNIFLNPETGEIDFVSKWAKKGKLDSQKIERSMEYLNEIKF